MKSMTRGNVKTAIKSLRANRMRTFLTMLGVIVGVVSVVSVVSIGEGVKQQISHQIDTVGKDLIIVRPGDVGSKNDAGTASISKLFGGLSVNGSLNAKDVAIIQKDTHVHAAVPLSVVGGSVTGTDSSAKGVTVLGAGPKLPEVLHANIAYGTYFANGEADVDSMAVLGTTAAAHMFDENVPLGRGLTIRGQNFITTGIFDALPSAPLESDVDFNNVVFISFATAQQLTHNNSPIYEILVRPKSPHDTSATIQSIDKALLAAHGGQRDFSVQTQQENLQSTSSVLNLLTALIGGVAAISLIVGGIGIMNIMLVSVTERMHEIGIRKAVGATNRQILQQFILESTLLSLAGGIVGIVICLLLELVLRLTTSLQPVVTWQISILALLVSVLVGAVFGSAPALKAARKDPIAALRNEL